jgi:hypothetical protein
MIRLKNLLVFLPILIFSDFCDAAPPQNLQSFFAEFAWVDATHCKIPKANPPSKLWIHGLDFNHGSKKRSFRRWIDVDGDDICELYDVTDLETSAFTEKVYGFPVRMYKFESKKWKKYGGGFQPWIPMILLDMKTKERIIIDYVYGNAGYSPSTKGTPVDCEYLRRYLGVGVMLYFNFPIFAQRDELTNPKGGWNDVRSGWFSSRYTDKDEILSSNLPSDCKRKYRTIIDALAERLER